MPNWTMNKITCKKHIGDKILTKTADGYSFDFNRLIPMPKSMKITAGTIETEAVASYYISLDKQSRRNIEDQLEKKKVFFEGNYWNKYKSEIDDYLHNPEKLKKIEDDFDGKDYESKKNYNSLSELGKQYVDNIIQHGYSQWYDWCNEVWGTKWNVKNEVDVGYDPISDEYEIKFSTAWSVPYGIVEEFSKLCSDKEFLWEYINEDYDGHHILRKENGVISDTVIDCDEDISDDIEM